MAQRAATGAGCAEGGGVVFDTQVGFGVPTAEPGLTECPNANSSIIDSRVPDRWPNVQEVRCIKEDRNANRSVSDGEMAGDKE